MFGVEAAIGLGIAAITAMATLTQKLHNRISELDKRVDGVELRVAETYVTKQDLGDIMDRVEGHMVRIENKLDRIVEKNAYR